VSRPARSEESLARVESELRGEQAAALRRIGERLAELLEELSRCRARLADLSGETRVQEREATRAVEAEARLFRWYLEVQRESVGLRDHRRLDEVYPRPERAER